MKYLESVKSEYQRYRIIAEGAVRQVRDGDLDTLLVPELNSIAIIMGHMSGNLKSRFTDFKTSDGEKPWRNREEEFTQKNLDRDELLQLWDDGWNVLFTTLDSLSDNDLDRKVQIRGIELSVHEALNRSLAHAAYHVGQIVLLARMLAEQEWKYLSIPKGKSADYNSNPTAEKEPPRPS
jgi:hypothetical protein